jgi:hypothetical protein
MNTGRARINTKVVQCHFQGRLRCLGPWAVPVSVAFSECGGPLSAAGAEAMFAGPAGVPGAPMVGP